jgi:hypothetical protein
VNVSRSHQHLGNNGQIRGIEGLGDCVGKMYIQIQVHDTGLPRDRIKWTLQRENRKYAVSDITKPGSMRFLGMVSVEIKFGKLGCKSRSKKNINTCRHPSK